MTRRLMARRVYDPVMRESPPLRYPFAAEDAAIAFGDERAARVWLEGLAGRTGQVPRGARHRRAVGAARSCGRYWCGSCRRPLQRAHRHRSGGEAGAAAGVGCRGGVVDQRTVRRATRGAAGDMRHHHRGGPGRSRRSPCGLRRDRLSLQPSGASCRSRAWGFCGRAAAQAMDRRPERVGCPRDRQRHRRLGAASWGIGGGGSTTGCRRGPRAGPVAHTPRPVWELAVAPPPHPRPDITESEVLVLAVLHTYLDGADSAVLAGTAGITRRHSQRVLAGLACDGYVASAVRTIPWRHRTRRVRIWSLTERAPTR